MHQIGRALLVALSGPRLYRARPRSPASPWHRSSRRLGNWPDAIGLSALLVTTSRQIRASRPSIVRVCTLQVLIGGAAIDALRRAARSCPTGASRRRGLLCRDVFEGLNTLDALTTARRDAFVAQSRRSSPNGSQYWRSRRAQLAPRRGSRAAPIPSPTRWGVRTLRPEIRGGLAPPGPQHAVPFSLGRFSRSPERYETLVREVFEPDSLNSHVVQTWLLPQIASGVFPCRAKGNSLVIDERTRLEFPRQASGERLCLADYYNSQPDVVALQAVTVGARPGNRDRPDARRPLRRDALRKWSGLGNCRSPGRVRPSSERQDLQLPADRGLRFSWGYAACRTCPTSERCWTYLDAERSIGLRLSDFDDLDPERSQGRADRASSRRDVFLCALTPLQHERADEHRHRRVHGDPSWADRRKQRSAAYQSDQADERMAGADHSRCEHPRAAPRRRKTLGGTLLMPRSQVTVANAQPA